MKSRFDKFFDLLIVLEGGYSDHSHDKGGKTNLGITKKTLDYYNNNYDKNYKIRDLTKEQAKEIYKELYFDKVIQVENEPVHYHYFDLCVNSGYENYSRCKKETQDDIKRVVDWRRKFYQDIVKFNSSQSVFLKGWFNRINRINAYFNIKV